jgi:peptidoglycan/xylan/chitin deacetylase (PgdA/CDA1 family)
MIAMDRPLLQLRDCLELLRSEGRVVDLFFRDDDADVGEESLRRLLHCFVDRDIPINLAIIPASLSDETIGLLASERERHPGLLCLTQHGWRHVNHEREGRKCEFGPSRSFDEQLDDIARGQARLDAAFDENWFPAFVPPWNRCTEVTHRVLDRLGFEVFSAKRGGEPVAGYRFREISITLDLYRWRGGAAMKAPEEIVDDLVDQCRNGEAIGVMLHHKVMDDASFEFLNALLDVLSESPVVRFHTFQSLL